jgi:2-aminomuconate deaminase
MKTTNKTIENKAKPLGKYPHIKRVGDFLYISGTSSRRADNTHEGVQIHKDGTISLDIKAQTTAVLNNINDILKVENSSLLDVIDITTFLVKMDDFKAYNEVYATFFSENPPTRTTVAVYQLPHPNLLIEIKAIAYKPL